MSSRSLATILFAAFALVAVVLVVGVLPTGTTAAPTIMVGDWEIDNGDVITRTNEEIHLTGDLIVHDGGLLTFRNVTLRMESDSGTTYGIYVEDGGRFNVYDEDGNSATTDGASLITAMDTLYNFLFQVEDGGELYFNHSDLQECGISGGIQNRGLYLESSSCTIKEVNITNGFYGIVIANAGPTVEDCNIESFSQWGIYMDSSSTDIDGCTIDGGTFGIRTSQGTPKVTDCTITDASSYGIYLLNSNADVTGTTIESIGYCGIYTNSNIVDIINCDMDDVGSYGIISYWSTLTVSGTDINDANRGMYLYRNAAGSSVSGGKVGNTTDDGIYVYLSPLTISNMEIHDTTNNGLYIYRTWGNTLTNVLVEDASVGAFVRDSTSAISGLTVVGGTTHGIQVSGGSPSMTGFAISSSGNGITVDSTGDLGAINGTISGSTTRDVNVAAGGEAELTNSSFTTYQVLGTGSALRSYWFVDIHGIWQDGSDIGGGTYTVVDQASTTVVAGTLDSSGWDTWLRVRQFEVTPTSTTTDTPHTITVSDGGLSGLTAATIDSSQTVTVTVTDNVPPAGYVMNAEPAFTQGTVNAVSWTAGSDTGVGAMEYYCHMATDAGFTSVVYASGWISTTTYTFIGLVDGTTYHYRVVARDGVGNVGAWSAGVSSTQDSSPPSVPVVVGEPAYTQGTSNTIDWGTSTDAGVGGVQYQAQYTDDPTFNTILGTTAWQAGTSRTFSGLTDGTTYLYRIKSRDSFNQESAWSSPVSSTQDNSAPSRPNAVTLPTYTQGLSVTFEWLASTDAGVGGIEYYAEYDTQSWFPSPDGNSGWVSGLSATFNGLPENTWHYFRVRAMDALGQTSAPSIITWTRNDNSAPSVPVMTVEPTYTAGNSNTVSWSASSDGAGAGGIQYWVETDTSAGFTSPDFASGWQTSRSYTFSSLADGTTYHFRVKSRDALDQESSFSAIQSSTQDSSPPPIPGIATEPTFTPGTTNTIEWTEVSDAGIEGERYQVQMDDAPSFATPMANSGWLTTTSYTFSSLTDGTQYYYRVRSRDAFIQISDWSGTTSSTQDSSAPPAPTMKQADWYNPGLYFVAEWTAVTDTGVGSVEYYCEYDDLANFASPNGNSGWTTALEYNFTGLQENRWYYYHVRARDALGQMSPWSALIFARQDNSAPTVPTMTAEPTWTAGTTNAVRWSASADTGGIWQITYQVEVGTTPSFNPPLATSAWITQRVYTFTGLQDATTYYYHVRAKDGLDQESAWSAVVASTQDSLPPPIPGVAPEPTYTAGTTNTIDWSQVTDAGIGSEQYQVEASTAPSFATVFATSGWTSSTSYTFSGLSDDTTYYYRVRSRDGFAQASEWSTMVSSTQDASAPTAPTMVQQDWYNPGLYFIAKWTAVSDSGVGGVEYYCEYDDVGNFASPNGNSGWTTALEYNFTGLQENRWYWYHAKARDALGQESSWSAAIFARQDNSPPSVPTMGAEPVWTPGTTNSVWWSASSDTGGIWQITYQVEIGTTPSFNPPLQTSTWITQRSYTFTGLQNDVLYYYHVRAKDGLDQESAWSAVVASTQDASPPPSPTMAAEPEYTAGTSNTVSWTTVTDNSGGTVQYRVYASLSSVFATTEGDSGWRTTATWTFSGLTDGSTYYYRVKARDQFGQEGAFSNIVSSTQDGTAPTGYSMVTEPTYTQGLSNTVYWNAATDAASGGVEYWCEADDDWLFRSPHGNSGWTTNLEHTFTSLLENRWYYYRVRARDAVGNTGGWSGVTWSRQDNSPPSVSVITALGLYTQGTAVPLAWSVSSDVGGIGQVTYKAQYASGATFSPVLGESLWQSERTYTFSGLQDSQIYYFRVKARDGLDQESGWSSWVSTTMDSQAPPSPFLSPEPLYTPGTSNTLSWTAVTDTGVGNVQYEIQGSTSPSFATINVTSGWITTTSHTFTGLTDGDLYYYRVHARDGFRQESGWSNVERSTQDNTPPPAPTIVTEPTYTAGTENTIYWGAVTDSASGGVQYWCEYDNDFFFRSPNGNSGWISTTEATFTGLAENTWWFYRVRARDAVGNLGAWSGTTWSRQDNTPPTAPTMSAEPTHTAGTMNTVAWSASSDGAGSGGINYQAEISLTNTFTTVLSTSPWTTQRTWTFTGLVDGWTYYYRVRARDALDHVSTYSNVVFSTQDASAPTAPFLTAEPAFTAGTANTITWTAVADGGVGNVEYEAQGSTSPTFATVGSSGWIRGTSFTFSSLSDGTTYYYRVRARDGFGQAGGWSNVERSTQDASPPSVPNFPAPDWIQPGTDLTMKWDKSTDAGVGGIQYWIEYDNDFLFRSPNGNSGWITETEHTFTDLAENTWWFFRVRARDAFGYTSAWSTTRWSRLDDSPPTIPGMGIEPAYTPGTSNQVRWGSSTDSGVGGVQYQVYVDDDPGMGSPMASSPWDTELSYTFSGLADGATYYYAVRSRDAFDHQSLLSNTVSSTQDASPPSTPVMELEPEFTQGTSNSVHWSESLDAGVGNVVYTVQWSTSSVFSTILGEYDRLDGTSATMSDLQDGVRYYYRVRARDLFSYTTVWSNIVWSTQDASAPPVPKMMEEPEFTKGTTNTVSWEAVLDKGVGGVEYLHQISTDGSFTNPIGTGWTTDTEETWGNLGDGNKYWYRVRSRDEFGQTSAWSAFVSSTQDDRAPGTPTLSGEPTVTQGTTNTVSWNSVTDEGVGGVQYEVVCSMQGSFATLHATSGWTTATSHTFSGLSDGVRYFYRVHARDAFDHVSEWSNVRSSTQDASPPSTPSMAAEPEFTQGLSNTVSWSDSVDAGIGGVTYFLQVASDGAFSDIIGTYGWGDGTSATFTGLTNGQTYYYRVMARDAFDYRTPWSSVVWSTQDASPPSRPVMDPLDMYSKGTVLTVEWGIAIDTGIGGVQYYVQWDNTPAFTSPGGASGWVPIREWTFSGLPENQALYFRVRARDALLQNSAWSTPVTTIMDNSPPSRPSLNDLPEYTKGRAVSASWNPAVDLGVAGVEYFAEWDDDPAFATPGGQSGWVASATHTFGGLPEGVTLYFRVKARDAFDHQTEWAQPQSTICDGSPPTIPYLASEPLYTEGTTNGMTWSTSLDAGVGMVEYRIQATSDPTWTVVDKDSGWLRATAHTFSGLSDGTTYYYRVQARDAFAWTSTWSPVVSSTQDASAPPVPVLAPQPVYTKGLDTTVLWSQVLDAGVGGEEYMVEVSPVATFSTLVDSSPWIKDTTWTFNGLSEGAPLYYRVRSRDGFDQRSSWSEAVSTTQDASPPQVPFVSPEPEHTPGSTNTVGWLESHDGGVGGVQYNAEVATDAGFADLVSSSGWTSQTSYTFRLLADGITYHYRVKARDAFDHESGWSTAVSSTQDDSAPDVAFDPLPAVISGPVQEVSGTAVDAGSGVAKVEFSSDGGGSWAEATYSTGTWSYTWTGYDSGTHELWVRATDALDNVMVTPTVAQATVDLDAPEANITSPAVNETLTGLIPVQGTAVDPHIARYNLYWTVDQVELTPIVEDQRFSVIGGTLAIWDTRYLDDGEYVLVLEVNDTSGRTTRTNVTVFLLNSQVVISPSDLFMSDPFPFKGDNVTISATFKNTGTSTARNVMLTIKDNDAILYEGMHNIGPGEQQTVELPYKVPDFGRIHTITATAEYDDNPDAVGNAASSSYTGEEVIVEPFFDTSEWVLLVFILAVLVVLVALFFLVWKRMGAVPAAMPGSLPVTTATFETLEPLGSDQIQWDDDSF
jgi:titin